MTKAEQLKRIVALAEELGSLQQMALGDSDQCYERFNMLEDIAAEAEEMLEDMSQ